MRKRHNNDAYYTASQLTQSLIDNVLTEIAQPDHTFLEPCNGIGAISSVLKLNNYTVMETWDIDETKPDNKICDASLKKNWLEVDVDWVVTNPPYTQPVCQQIIENSFVHVRCGIAMLLRLSYDEPCKERAEWLRTTIMSHQIIFNPRPRFRTDCNGSDNVTSCWFVWLKDDYAHEVSLFSTKKIYVTDWR